MNKSMNHVNQEKLTTSLRCGALVMLLLISTAALAQVSSASSIVPMLVNFNGNITDASNKPLSGIHGVTFFLYKDSQGGAPVWMETQNVQADSRGHYTVVLGSNTSQGLPKELFASGEARWLGVKPEGQEEQPRVLLVSVPYALKSADAETLGGLPASAFVQAASNLAGGTARAKSSSTAPTANPQATITGSGKTNFLPIWTGTTTLGNSTLFQTGGKVGIGTTTPGALLDVNGAATIRKSLNVTGSVNASAANFTGNNTSNIATITQNGTGVGLSISAPNGLGLGVSSTSFPYAMLVSGGYYGAIVESSQDAFYSAALFAEAAGNTQETFGVYGYSASMSGAGVFGQVYQGSITGGQGSPGAGVWGDAGSNGDTAVLGTSDDSPAFVGINNSDLEAAFFYNQRPLANGIAPILYTMGDGPGSCQFDTANNFYCSGSKSAVVPVDSGRSVALYAVEATENWFEDFGTGKLSNGAAKITFDTTYSQTVNTGLQYHIFLTPKGDCKGLYVSNEGPGGFEVHELAGGNSAIEFDYRIVARRKGYEKIRMADMTERMKKGEAHKATLLRKRTGSGPAPVPIKTLLKTN